MKITRHTAGNLSLHRISIAITLVYYSMSAKELQAPADIFFRLFCKLFVNPEKAAEVVERHLIGGHPVEKYTLNSADIK